MKKRIALVMALLLCALTLTSALADLTPLYPSRQGQVTDAACVLSASTVNDLKQAAKTIADKAQVDLVTLTVDFTDGFTPETYAQGLFKAWKLEDHTLLLLIAVGQDECAIYVGKNVRLTDAACKKLAASMAGPILAQQYDEAVATLMPALVNEINKAYDVSVNLGGLFGVTQAQSEDWLERLIAQATSLAAATESHAQKNEKAKRNEEEKDGVSLFTILISIWLLTIIFGRRRRRSYDRRFRGGRGRNWLTTILAVFGLWKLWDRHH